MPSIVIAELDSICESIQQTKSGKVLTPYPKIQRQEGPNCGFYALSIVMDYWKAKGVTTASTPARKRDVELQKRDAAEKDAKSLRKIAKEIGSMDLPIAKDVHLLAVPNPGQTSTGGVFTAAQLAEVAKAVQTAQFEARCFCLNTPQSLDQGIRALINAGIPPIVAFDVEKGDPVSNLGGQHSHWGLVFGYYEEAGTHYYLATHGHASYYRWAAEEFQKSNFALKDTVRTLDPEVKMRLIKRDGTVPENVPDRMTRWHWRTTTEIRRDAPNLSPDLKIELKQGSKIRPSVQVSQDLAGQVVMVKPTGYKQA